MTSDYDDVTTIFVVGFPDDMQEREFQNMFAFSKGFEAASLKWHSKEQEDENLASLMMNKKQMIGFARFHTRLEAYEAAEIINGRKVDYEKGTTLKAEMAKKNLHVKQQQQKTSIDTFNTIRPTQTDYYETFSPLPSNLLSPRDYKADFFSNESLNLSPTPSSFGDSLFGIRPFSFEHKTYKLFSNNDTNEQEDPSHCPSKHTSVYSTLDKLQKISADQNPPCNTLYIGNIPTNTNEEELRTLFSACQGYKRMVYRQKNQGPMCFVEFEDVPFAAYAIKHLQGQLLTQSGKSGIRLSFSKNPLFMKNNTSAFHLKRLGTALLADL
ncbi:hypothetical protein K501DRAFT_298741 [Backusella circina FSU 941]|nr:hypothetical protein K501DRAFT_298741 [Backusella circina FSU 941]